MRFRPLPLLAGVAAAALIVLLSAPRDPVWSLEGTACGSGGEVVIDLGRLAENDAPRLAAAAPVQIASIAVPRKNGVPTRKVASDGMSRGMRPPERLKLNLEGRDIVTIYSTGQIDLADGLTMDEASRDFWRKIAELAPSFCAQQVGR